jgi:hypothetical protein
MGLRDYEVDNDKFEPDSGPINALSFPCCACTWQHKTNKEPPCCYCGHNVNAKLEETVPFKRLLFASITEHEGYLCDVGLPEGHTAVVFTRDDGVWDVVHVQSGLDMRAGSMTREGAINQARENWKNHPLPLERLDRHASEFQERMNAKLESEDA